MKQGSSKYGIWTSSSFIVANMIGTGVFTSLGFQLLSVDNFFLIMLLWLIGGIIALCGSLVYGELGAVMPRSGGEYHFLGKLYSPMMGFLAGWISLVVGFSAPVALACLAFSEYVTPLIPWANPKTVAVIVLSVLTLVHLFSLFVSGWVQNALTALKVIAIIGFIIIGFLHSGDSSGVISQSVSTFRWGDLFSGGFAVCIIWVYYAYSGWNAAAYIVDDIEKPQVNLPRALFFSTLFVTVLYLLLNAMFLLSTPADSLKGEVEIGLIVANHLFGSRGNVWGWIIAFFLLSSCSSMIFVGPRVSCRMGEDHAIFRFLSWGKRKGIPTNAIIFQYLLSLFMILTGTFKSITEYSGILLSLCSLLTVLGLFIHRKRYPDMERPFRTPLYPLTPILFGIPLVASIFFLMWQSVWNLVFSGGILLIGIIVYYIDKYAFEKTRQ